MMMMMMITAFGAMNVPAANNKYILVLSNKFMSIFEVCVQSLYA